MTSRRITPRLASMMMPALTTVLIATRELTSCRYACGASRRVTVDGPSRALSDANAEMRSDLILPLDSILRSYAIYLLPYLPRAGDSPPNATSRYRCRYACASIFPSGRSIAYI